MKRYRKANAVMAGAAVLFIAALWYKTQQPSQEAKMIYFMAQSLLIGCLADWFAVNAIFRNPIPLLRVRPLVSAYQHQISLGLQKFFDTVLMREEDVEKSLSSFSLIRWLQSHDGSREKFIRAGTRQIFEFVWKEWDQRKEDLSRIMASKLQDSSDEISRLVLGKIAGPQISRLLYEFFLKAIFTYVKTDDFQICLKKSLDDKVKEESGSILKGALIRLMNITGALDTEALSKSVQYALAKGIEGVLNPDSEEGALFFEEWQKGLAALSQNDAAQRILKEYLLDIANIAVKKGELAAVIDRWEKEWKENPEIRRFWEDKAFTMGNALCDQILSNPKIEETIDGYARLAAFYVFKKEKDPILQSLRQLLDHFHSKDFSEIIEERVWPWLEDIRLNGAIVGLLAGAFFYVFIFFIYIPFIRGL